MEELTPLLNGLAAQLNTTVEFLWSVLLYQARVEVAIFIVYLVLFIFFTIGVFKFVGYAIRQRGESGSYSDSELGWTITIIVVLIFEFICLACLFFGASNAVTALLNPEYWALQQILELIR